MPKDVNAPSTRTTYHHGTLRETLLADARTMLAERGPEGFSLNELARRAGVSTAAPYRHFADREELLCLLADEGYVRFGRRLTEAREAAVDEADALHRLGVAYLAFADEERPVFEIMFQNLGEGRAPNGPPTFDTLVAAVADAQTAGVLPADQPAVLLSRTVWAVLHGVAVLRARGGLSKLGLDDSLEALAEQTLAPLRR